MALLGWFFWSIGTRGASSTDIHWLMSVELRKMEAAFIRERADRLAVMGQELTDQAQQMNAFADALDTTPTPLPSAVFNWFNPFEVWKKYLR